MRSIALSAYLLSTLLFAMPAGKPCIGLPAKLNAGSIVGVVPVSVQDIPILSNPQIQQCKGNTDEFQFNDDLLLLVGEK
jgi:hypothetical protein